MSKLYREPHNILSFDNDKARVETIFHLIARILRLMKAFEMKTQNNISIPDVKDCAARLAQRCPPN